MPVIDDLTVRINMKGGKDSVSTMKQLKVTTLAAKTAILAAVVGLAKMSQEARRLAMNMDVFEKATGLSSKVLERMSFKAASAGISLDNYGDTLQRIQQMTMDIARGQGNIAPFQLHGIGVNKDPIKVMDQISRRLKQLQRDPARAAQLAQDFGLSNEMMYALMQGQTEELEEQWLLKAKDKDALVKLNREWYKLWWYTKQIGIISQGFLAHTALPIVKATTKLVKALGEILFAASEWYSRTAWIKDFMTAIAIITAGILIYLHPIIASIILIAIALEDVWGYFHGEKSITGGLIEWIKSGKILKDIFMTIAEVLRSISKFFFGSKATKKIFDFFGGKDATSGAQVGFANNLKSLLPDFSDFAPIGITGVPGGLSVTQHNVANFISRGAKEDAEAAGAFASEAAAVDNSAMQNPELSRGNAGLGVYKLQED